MKQGIKHSVANASIMSYSVVLISMSYILTQIVTFALLFSALGNTGKAELLKLSDAYAGEVHSKLATTINYLSVVEALIETHAGSDSADRIRLQQELLNTLNVNAGLIVLMEANAYDGEDAEFADTAYGTPQSGKISYYYLRKDDVTRFSIQAMENEDSFIQSYYLQAKEANAPVFTNPFFDEVDGEQVPMIVVSLPINNDRGDFLGAVAAEIYLTDLYDQLHSEEVFYSGYLFITDEEDQIIYHPDYSYIGKERSVVGSTFHMAINGVTYVKAGETSFFNRRNCFIATTEVEVLGFGNRLYISAIAPWLEIHTEWIRLTIVFSIISILVLSLILYFFSRSVIRPIKDITRLANMIAHDDPEGRKAFSRLNTLDVEKDTKNEILLLYITTRKMIGQLDQIQRMRLEALELQHQKEHAEESTRTKSNFLARMSHEIRTPMNAIVGMSELVIREETSAEVRDLVEGIRHAGANLLNIINDILDFTKIESGKTEIIPEKYNPARLVGDVVNIIRTRVLEKPILFAVDTDPAIPRELVGDEARIRQILVNLMGNAVKYTEKGHIRLFVGGVRQGDGYRLIVDVEDTGVGIHEEDLGKLFGDFVQVDQIRNRNVQGTGLGLAISKRLCQEMGGEITVRSVYREGSIFTISLPQEISDSQPFAQVEDVQEKRVLLCEARRVYADSLSKQIRGLGVECTCAEDMARFRKEIKTGQYAYIFISSFMVKGMKAMLDKEKGQGKVFALAEFGETAGSNQGDVIEMPAHSATLAHVLNGKPPRKNDHESGDAEHHFIAPEARILIVDDITTNLHVAQGLMSPYDMQIETCKSGQDAIALIMASRYDIVFMDHMMPGMDGLEATAIIRSIESGDDYYRKLPIVALTANAVSGVREVFIQGGMSDFLSKPIDLKKLESILEYWIPKDKQLLRSTGVNEPVSKERLRHMSGTMSDPVPEQPVRLAVPAETLDIKGVDVQAGLVMAGGKEDFYYRTLAAFYIDGTAKLDEIRQALDGNNIVLYTTYVHALKSAAASIGALSLSKQAKLLEDAGRSGDVLFIYNFTEDLIEKLRGLLAAIEPYLPSKGSEPADEETLALYRTELGVLRIALDGMDMGGIDRAMTTLQEGSFGGTGNRVVEALASHVLMFEYGEAVSLIDEALKS